VQTLGFGKLAAYHSNNGKFGTVKIIKYIHLPCKLIVCLLVQLWQNVSNLDPHTNFLSCPAVCAAHVLALCFWLLASASVFPFVPAHRVWFPVGLCQGLQGAAGAAGGVQQVKLGQTYRLICYRLTMLRYRLTMLQHQPVYQPQHNSTGW
jgi:hypothetical protein